MGVDVLNLQDLVNGIDWIREHLAGRCCIELDVDRQKITPYGTPADIDRLTHQIDAICDYVDEILVYEYIGIMNKPGTIAYAGHPDSVSYYEDYKQAISKNAQEE